MLIALRITTVDGGYGTAQHWAGAELSHGRIGVFQFFKVGDLVAEQVGDHEGRRILDDLAGQLVVQVDVEQGNDQQQRQTEAE